MLWEMEGLNSADHCGAFLFAPGSQEDSCMRTVEWDYDRNLVKMIDQRQLPSVFEIAEFSDYHDVAKAIRPKILYPYHYSGTDPQELVGLLKSDKEIEVRVREMP